MVKHIAKKKLITIIATLAFFTTGLAITSYALVKHFVEIDNNEITMGEGVDLNINGGNPIIDTSQITYEPGGTYSSTFTLENRGTFDVWYRVYPTDVEGPLKDYITLTVKEQDGTVMCSGSMGELKDDGINVGTLLASEEKTLSIELYFVPGADNAVQGKTVSFKITANATQKQNNPDKDFGD